MTLLPSDGKPKRRKKAKPAQEEVQPVRLVPDSWELLALARDSGRILSINAQAVHRHDHFDYAYGLAERLEHVPAAGDRGDITHFYAYVRFKDGGHHFEVMPRAEVDAVRDRSESYRAYRAGKAESSAWVTGYAEMGKEIVLRRIARYLPLNVQKAAALADLHEAGRHAALDDLGEIVVDFPRMELESAPAVEPETISEPQREGPAPEAVDLTEEELAGLFPPIHIVRILDAMSERDMPEEVLAEIAGAPLEEVAPEDEAAILRAIAFWQP